MGCRQTAQSIDPQSVSPKNLATTPSPTHGDESSCERTRGLPYSLSASSLLSLFATNKEAIAAHYTIQEPPLSEGREAVVRKGTDRKTGTVVAIKTFKHCTNGLEWFYLHTQIELLQKCHDPHVIGLQDVYDNDGLFHIVTELADGGDLQTYLKAHGPLDERTAGYFVREILGGLAYLHDTASIVHCDLKLENVVLTGDMRVKLIDFGVATEFPRGTKSFELGKVVGTAAYLAPECWTGTYGTGSDMWALGVLACYLLFSEPPTGTAENCSSMSERRVAERIDALLGSKKMTEECKDFLRKLLKIQPEERMGAAEALQHPWVLGAHAKINNHQV